MGSGEPGGQRAVFLDRDGVINRNVRNSATGEEESPLRAEDFSLLPGVIASLRSLRTAGYLLFLVSNQPNHAKGKASLATLEAIHNKFGSYLEQERIEFAAFYYCLHHPQGVVAGYSGACVCRKPQPYFLFEAQRGFGLDLRRSWMVGDRMTDVECGAAAGAATILISREGTSAAAGGVRPGSIAVDLAAATRQILAGTNQPMGGAAV